MALHTHGRRGTNPPGQRTPPGQGQRLGGRRGTPVGQRTPPGQRLGGRRGKPVGQRTPPGQRPNTGRRPPPGQQKPKGGTGQRFQQLASKLKRRGIRKGKFQKLAAGRRAA